MNKLILGIVAVLLVALGVRVFLSFTSPTTDNQVTQKAQTTPATTPQSTCANPMVLGQDIAELSITRGQKIVSGVLLTGKIKGGFCFEAVCPIKIVSDQGDAIFSGVINLQGDWMTDELVPFQVSLMFDNSVAQAQQGKIIIGNDNPSGLAENERCYEIPVTLADN